jgi:hypothetical protein
MYNRWTMSIDWSCQNYSHVILRIRCSNEWFISSNKQFMYRWHTDIASSWNRLTISRTSEKFNRLIRHISSSRSHWWAWETRIRCLSLSLSLSLRLIYAHVCCCISYVYFPIIDRFTIWLAIAFEEHTNDYHSRKTNEQQSQLTIQCEQSLI